MKVIKTISLILVFVFFASLLVHPINSINQDIGRHIKSGQLIWESKEVHKTNLFSFTEPDRPFINHHWLSEVVFYHLEKIVGLSGLIILKVLVLLLALGLIYTAIKRHSPPWTFIVAMLAGVPVFLQRTDVRPEIFSYLFLSFFIFAIFKAKYSSEKRWLYALPLIQILWTNMHIYFAIGPALALFWLIDRYFKERAQIKRYFILFILICGATLLNPNFISGALYPLRILGNYGYSIVENQNIIFLRDYGISIRNIQLFQFSLIVLIISFIIAVKHKVIGIFEVITMIFMSLMAFMMIRNFGLYAISFIPIVAINLSSLKPKISYLSIFYPLVLVGLIVATTNVVGSQQFGLTVPGGAGKAIEFVKINNLEGPIFNNFDVGSYLIWKLYPKEKVFVDGRPEAYSVTFFEDIYKPMQADPGLWKKYSEEYKINYVIFDHHDITPWARTFLSFMSKDKNWPMVYLDEYVVIFLRKSGNEELIQKLTSTEPEAAR